MPICLIWCVPSKRAVPGDVSICPTSTVLGMGESQVPTRFPFLTCALFNRLTLFVLVFWHVDMQKALMKSRVFKFNQFLCIQASGFSNGFLRCPYAQIHSAPCMHMVVHVTGQNNWEPILPSKLLRNEDPIWFHTLWISIYIQMWVPLLVLQAWNSYPSPCRLRLFGTLPMMHQLKRTLSIKQLKLALERPGRWWVCTNVICPVYKQSVCCVISILIDLCFMMMNLLTLGPWGGHCAHTRTHNAVSLVKRTVGKDGKKRAVSWWHVPYLLAMMRKWYRLEWRFEKNAGFSSRIPSEHIFWRVARKGGWNPTIFNLAHSMEHSFCLSNWQWSTIKIRCIQKTTIWLQVSLSIVTLWSRISTEVFFQVRITYSQWLHPVNFSRTPCELFLASSGWKQRCLAQKCWIPTWLWSSSCGPCSGPICPAPWNSCGFGSLPRGRHPRFTRWFNCE